MYQPGRGEIKLSGVGRCGDVFLADVDSVACVRPASVCGSFVHSGGLTDFASSVAQLASLKDVRRRRMLPHG